MGIMGCYPDERAIENELGGKWGKFYEYTFEDTHTEAFEFPTDLDGTPLNLNGLMIVFERPARTTTIIDYVNINGQNYSVTSGATAATTKGINEAVIRNGLLHFDIFQRQVAGASAALNRFPNILQFINAITNFKVSCSTTNETGTKLTIYVLRGV